MKAGVDEVGRGALCGPVVAAAVILDPKRPIVGLCDSKALNSKQRQWLFTEIQEKAIDFKIGQASVKEIEDLNILQASLLAMKRAVEKLSIKPTEVLVDGNHSPNLSVPVKTIIQGDKTIFSISAASIIAKVTRDTLCLQLHERYPEYGIAQHKGYPTKAHLNALSKYGASDIHRKTYLPVARVL